MKTSFQKLQKVFKLEADRGYDNRAVVGGIERMLEVWETEARLEGVPEDLIQFISVRFRDYGRLSEKSRAEALQGIWRRIQRSEDEELGEFSDRAAPPTSAEPAPPREEQPAPEAPAESKPPPEAPKYVRSKSRRKEVEPSVEPTGLNAPVTVLQGIGKATAQNLSRLGLFTLRDMLYYFPRRHNNYSKLSPINRLRYGDEVTVIGTVQNIRTRPVRQGKMTLVEALVNDGSASLRVTWFNQTQITRKLFPGAQVSLSAKVDQYLGRLVMTNPEYEALDAEHLSTNRIVPVYSITETIRQGWLRKQMHQVVSYWAPRVIDPLPESIRDEAGLMDLPDALLQAHFPDSEEELLAAKERLAFDEIFQLQLGLLGQKRVWQERSAQAFPVEQGWLEAQLARLPYTLTGAQQRALEDVVHDLGSGRPMNRLIQGDVGSGKTVIAGLAIAIIASHGCQACLMAPTSLLAEQHYRGLKELLTAPPPEKETAPPPGPPVLSEEEIRLLIGATPEAEKEQIRAGLADGTIKLVVGTHALIEDPVAFANLELAIVDEQHRFGVRQRAALRAKGENPHLMVTTATPIPRSLALTVYGDLDLTLMDELPPGRQPVSTHVLMPRERERAYTLIRSQIEQGRQAFVIYPLVEESEKSEALAAVEEQQRLQNEIFPHLRVGLLHGRMKAEEKEAVMDRFRQGEYSVLVSTTVVEVGVDIPNATVMLIEGANRFGLAQLHQLRGRVGRGAEKSYCLLIPDEADEIENERLEVMASTNDGFVLAERDLAQRGPGQFLGTRQSGFSELRLTSYTNLHLIEKARRIAMRIFEDDPDLSKPEHQLLASSLQQFWKESAGDIS